MNKKGFLAAAAAVLLTAAQAVPAGADTVEGLRQKTAESW